MSKYLLEIGVEELPYSLIEPISEQIKENFKKFLQENNAGFSDIKTYTTPRRLVFVIDGLNEVQPDTEKVFRGPNAKVAYDANGNVTQAAMGFARKFGADVSALYKVEDAGQEYVALKVSEKGQSVYEIMPKIVPDCVLKVQGSHFMRWAGYDEKFSRPIRWIVSILDDKEVPVEITGIKSSKKSRAHRFCSEKFTEITSVDAYFDIMLKHNVIVDEEQRKAEIVKSVNELAASIGAQAKIEPELLKEVTNIVEFPRPVLGNFDEKYLAIPEPVIVTVMASHQRYFPIYKNGKLLNGFITVANYVGDDFSNIKNGNERVIKARLDDAIFFYNEDIKKPLMDRIESLDGMTFQKGLGSIKEKVSRIIKISDKIAKELGYDDANPTYNDITRTALFCKADLATSLVFEFTELQGVIGAHYARVFGENENVVKGIEEHYYPLVADADLAESITGQVVGIADKLDTICGVFILNKIPSGSVDPLGVRRAAVGILQTVMQKKLQLNLTELIRFAISRYDVKVENPEKLVNDISAFFIQRLKGIFANNYQPDYIDAVLSASDVLNSLDNIVERLDLMASAAKTAEFEKLVAAHTRISKISKTKEALSPSIKGTGFSKDDILADKDKIKYSDCAHSNVSDKLYEQKTEGVNPSLFNCEAEDNFYRGVMSMHSCKTASFTEKYNALVGFVPVIDKFFEDVMVMDNNPEIKNNRLKLLQAADKEFLKIADFTKIVK
ncbi:MAG: glycine--tRNA ligase subunit beta [bacterium]|nr:glycine--tRNA ligase subunit beta [bacterium]